MNKIYIDYYNLNYIIYVLYYYNYIFYYYTRLPVTRWVKLSLKF